MNHNKRWLSVNITWLKSAMLLAFGCLLLLSHYAAAATFTVGAQFNYKNTASFSTQHSTDVYLFDKPSSHDGWRLVVDSPLQMTLRVVGIKADNSSSLIGSAFGVHPTQHFKTTDLADYVKFRVEVSYSSAVNVSYTLASEDKFSRALAWDAGTAMPVSIEAPNVQGVTAGDWLFKLTLPNQLKHNFARVVLDTESTGREVHLEVLNQATSTRIASSTETGDDVVFLSSQALAGNQDIYIKVKAANYTNPAQWRLYAGDIYVVELGALQADYAAVAPMTVGVEQHIFYRTTVADANLGWRLFLTSEGGASKLHDLYIRKDNPAMPTLNAFDRQHRQQALLVPDYLSSGSYFVTVKANAGTVLNLKSSTQPVIDLGFSASTGTVDMANSDFTFRSYRVQVPVEQIAWQSKVTPLTGEADIYVRRDKLANHLNNDGFSAAGGNTVDTVTYVPPKLGSGNWFITIAATQNTRYRLDSGIPVITDIDFVNDPTAIVNDAQYQNSAGWRYYRVSDIQAQLAATLGWQLKLLKGNGLTRIAIRRNAVPSMWQYRQNDNSNVYEDGHYDDISRSWLLQRPRHEADIWYIGVYNSTALGAFEFTSSASKPDVLNFNNGSINVTAQDKSEWRFFKVTVPNDATGWLLKLTNVTAGSPRMVVSRDRLPDGLQTTYCGSTPLSRCTEWPSSAQLAAANVLSQRDYDAAGNLLTGRELLLGMNNPLQAGTYYVGVRSDSDATYTLQSTGIGGQCGGQSCQQQITELAYNQQVTATLASPGAMHFYKVQVPEGTTGWYSAATPQNGGITMAVNQTSLPSSFADFDNSVDDRQSYDRGGRLSDLAGTEFYYRLERLEYDNNQSSVKLRGGQYYIVVTSQGDQNRSQSQLGSGAVSYSLQNGLYSALDRTSSPITASQGQQFSAETFAPGQTRSYRVRVGADVTSLQAVMSGLGAQNSGWFMSWHAAAEGQGRLTPSYANSSEGGVAGSNALYSFTDSIGSERDYTITLSNPTTQPLTLGLNLTAVASPDLAFNNGVVTVRNQDPGTWRYFKVVVPADAMGWDLKLTNQGENSSLVAVVRKDIRPDQFGQNLPTFFDPMDPWPTGLQVMSSGLSFTPYNQQRLLLSMGAPLTAGTYYIGVSSNYQNSTNAALLSYELHSRGIGKRCAGQSCAIEVKPLALQGEVTGTINTPAELHVYEVEVPEGTSSWSLENTATQGEVGLLVDYAFTPNNGNTSSRATDDSNETGSNARLMPSRLILNKTTDYFYKAREMRYDPAIAQQRLMLSSGRYYVAVVGQGNASISQPVGEGASAYRLRSSAIAVNAYLSPELTAGMQQRWQNEAIAAGQIKFYRVRVAPGASTLNLQLSSSNTAAKVAIYASRSEAGGDLYPPAQNGFTWLEGGAGYVGQTRDNQLTITDPSGEYTIAVAVSQADTLVDLALEVTGEVQLPFNNGDVSVTEQSPGSWRYFKVTVPENALGWNLELFSEQSLTAIVRRADKPTYNGSNLCNYNGLSCREWPEGGQVHLADRVSQRQYTPSNNYRFDQQLLVGMNTPLQPGEYFVGIQNPGQNARSYTLRSRGIGEQCGAQACAVPVTNLSLNSPVQHSLAQAEQLAVYKIQVPAGMGSLGFQLDQLSGDALLMVGKDNLPNLYSRGFDRNLPGAFVDKPGNEFFYLYATKRAEEQYKLSEGDYYAVVVSQGQGSTTSNIGQGAISYRFAVAPTPEVNASQTPLVANEPKVFTQQQLANSTHRVYRFKLAQPTDKVEVQLRNVTGNPRLSATYGVANPLHFPLVNTDWVDARTSLRSVSNSFGGDIYNYMWGSRIANLYNVTDEVVVTVSADISTDGSYVDASYDLVVTASQAQPLSFEGGRASAQELIDEQSALYKVTVPTSTADGQAVAGWRISSLLQSGATKVKFAKAVAPDHDALEYDGASADIVASAPYLTAGEWFIEVKSSGLSRYELRSDAARGLATWQLPTSEADGVFQGDSGEVDISKDSLHFYKLEVPEGNNGLIRTELINISGNTDVYLRRAVVPTNSHNASGARGQLFDFINADTGTSYANWGVQRKGSASNAGDNPLQLTPGTWWIAVNATASNSRYRLKINNGNIQPMALNSSKTSQLLAAGDMRYYKVRMPVIADSSPLQDWTLQLTQQRGDVIAHVRRDLPPVHGSNKYDMTDLWSEEYVNSQLEEGSITIAANQLWSGAVYYVGVYAKTDAQFDLTSQMAGGSAVIDAQLQPVAQTATYQVPANSQFVVRVVTPADLEIYRHHLTLPYGNDIKVYLSRGRSFTASPYNEIWGASALNYREITLEQRLINRDLSYQPLPWQPTADYYLTMVNKTNSVQPVTVAMQGTIYQPDTRGPVFTALPDLIVSATGVTTLYEPPRVWAQDDYDGSIEATRADLPALSIGVHTITWRATDRSGNTTTATQKIIVSDQTAPVFAALTDIVMEAKGVTTPVAQTIKAQDAVDGDVVAVADRPGPYTVGSHFVTWVATDRAGNRATSYQTIRITDTTAPVFKGGAALQVATPLSAGIASSTPAIQQWLAGISVTDNADAQPRWSHNLPAQLPVGKTTVRLTATDVNGNSTTVNTVITVVFSNAKPVIKLPANLSLIVQKDQQVTITDPAIVQFLAAASATDTEDGNVAVTHNAPTVFPLGTTEVTFTATDSINQVTTAKATVTVRLAGSKRVGMNPVMKIILMSKGQTKPSGQ